MVRNGKKKANILHSPPSYGQHVFGFGCPLFACLARILKRDTALVWTEEGSLWRGEGGGVENVCRPYSIWLIHAIPGNITTVITSSSRRSRTSSNISRIRSSRRRSRRDLCWISSSRSSRGRFRSRRRKSYRSRSCRCRS